MLESKKIDLRAVGACVYMIVRYLYHEKGLRHAGIVKYIDEFMPQAYPYYNEANWYKKITRYVSKAKTHPLVIIPEIPITLAEIGSIRSVNNETKEKLLFTLLCLAKYNNLYKGAEVNNNWVNFQDSVIFSQAKVTGTSTYKDYLIYELKEAGYVTNNIKNSTVNIKVNFVDDESPSVLRITDMHELGYQYLLFKGNKSIKKCKACGKYFRARYKNVQYCNPCKKKEPQEFKVINCKVCGNPVTIPIKDNRTTMCQKHRTEHQRERQRKKNATRNKSNPE